MHSEGYSTWSVCLLLNIRVTFHVIIRATNDTNLLSSGWRSKILSDFLWKCFVVKLERFLLVQLHVIRKTCECSELVFRSKQKLECNLREKTGPVKERQKFVSELCMGRNKTQSWVTRQWSISSQHTYTSTITCTATPRVWHFSAFRLR